MAAAAGVLLQLHSSDILSHPSTSSPFEHSCRSSSPSRPLRRYSSSRLPPVSAHCSSDSCNLIVDHHSALGVSSGASKLEIKRAYRLLARQFHPDVCKDRCSEQWFKHINHAYESLMSHGPARSDLRPASCDVATFCSEAGYESLEDLLKCCEGEGEGSYSPSSSLWRGAIIDWSWLQLDEQQGSMDANVFTAAAEETAEEMEIAWLGW